MYVDISKPPPPLPEPRRTEISTGVSLLQPLSRRGTGPGIVLVVPDSTSDNLTIKDGVPSPLIKWAEESYTVVEIQERALKAAGVNLPDVLQKAVKAIVDEGNCVPKQKVGVLVYNADLWNLVAPHLSSHPVAGAIIYANADEESSLTRLSIPCLKHLAGGLLQLLVLTEALSHTRNLSFLKPLMNGPYFDLETIWDEHTYFEFENRSVEWTMSTMVQEPYVNHIPTMTGGVGREQLTHFYANHFIFKNPSDAELEVVSRTVGVDRVVDEFIYKITHDCEVDWLIPGIPPTGKKLEIPMMAVVNIRGDRLYHEHISWDQGTVLSQLGLLPEYLCFPYRIPRNQARLPGDENRFEVKVPVAGTQTAAKMRDRNAVDSNGMFSYGVREVEGSK